MYKITKLPVACFLLLSFVCNDLYAWGDPGLSKLSGRKGNQLYLYLIDNNLNKWPPADTSDTIKNYIEESPHLMTIINDRCNTQVDTGPVPQVAGAAAAIIAAGGKLLFDLYMDAQIRKVDELKKSAQASYSEKIALSAGELKKARCALIIRDTVKIKEKEGDIVDGKTRALGFLALIWLENKEGRAFIMSPLYVVAKNAVARTKEGDKNDPTAINISIAVSTKGIGKQESTGVPGLFPVGEGVFSMANIPIDSNNPSDSNIWCNKKKPCPKSDLVVYPDEGPVSVSFVVSETGKIGYDVDQYITELKAVKEAMGPAVKDALKESLK